MKSKFVINVRTKTIRHVEGDEIITAQEFYSRLKKAFDNIPDDLKIK